MQTIPIHTEQHHYNVYIGEGLRHQLANFLPKSYNRVFVITDDIVSKLYLHDVQVGLPSDSHVSTFVVPAGEQSKSFEQFEGIHTAAIKSGLDRNSLIIALGGGMVGDLAGFIASTYMRGIDFIQVPTTILAHDSSVGGKVAINHPLGKNLIGNFHQPVAVIYDMETLKSLPTAEVRSGMAEVMKHAWISDEKFLHDLLQNESLHTQQLADAIVQGIKVKAAIVSEDEKESGIRKYLNFGHTLGHAIESELGYGRITHGEAVAVGMLFALHLSEKYNNITLPTKEYQAWLRRLQYPLGIIEELPVEGIVARMIGDKKNRQGEIHMVLLESVGKPKIVPFKKDQIQFELTRFQEGMKHIC
ncbi:3-dehydroquinate synthase [Salirhabdus salicampi]|uniref:3-dehydroquinate synthase n=1 Tax=Salirhabdus salicampi TaxID=476102 RepID=UPI0020C2A403|nr:3-dehydroquinate synthase [Salirhabdus salicampi]MCP8616698.1 3-dehydroquinate synthase [Salirhabdus salicampi]